MTLRNRLAAGLLLLSALSLVQSASASSVIPLNAATRASIAIPAAYRASIGTSRVSIRHGRARVTHTRAHRRPRVFWNPLLRGSHESLLRQNEEIDQQGLPRIQDDAQLQQLVEREELVPLYDTKFLRIAGNLKEDRRLCRPVTREFLDDLSHDYYEQFRQPIQVNSAVRTVEQQRILRRHNGNAAPESGETASSHLSGLTVDIAKRGMTRKQHSWLEQYLADLKSKGMVEPEEERRQAVFHVMVYQRYDQRHENDRAQADDQNPIQR
jgi:hypothetical protein